MKSRSIIFRLTLFTLLGCSFSSSNENFILEWILKENQPLLFQVVYENLDGDLKFDFEEYESEGFSSSWFNEDLETLFDSSNQYAVLSFRSDNLLNASMITVPSQSSGTDFFSFNQKGEVNHGIISRNGRNESFFLSPVKKNIFSLFFQLPEKPVQIGQEWEIDLNLINDQGLIYPDSSQKSISVKLNRVEDREAFIHYEIEEYLSGKYDSKFFETRATIKGKAVFLLEEGNWKRFDVVMKMESDGFLKGSQQIRFALNPVKNVPPKVFEMLEASKE